MLFRSASGSSGFYFAGFCHGRALADHELVRAALFQVKSSIFHVGYRRFRRGSAVLDIRVTAVEADVTTGASIKLMMSECQRGRVRIECPFLARRAPTSSTYFILVPTLKYTTASTAGRLAADFDLFFFRIKIDNVRGQR